jgi:glycosyltransferase involved in cell wall biosynthesis
VLRNKIYYGLKPLIPQPIRMEVRRRIAARTREHVGGVWPIMPGSERPPEGWPGWPNGKKFALVLTHDVEGRSGLEKVRRLADLEREMGFRSSFNFIPEGSYKAPAELREELARDGFEVAVHDLNHDGRLYRSRREFTGKARKINKYLSEWGAVGFRSGFMLSNLDWHHELEIDYDMSTFDTDPFEPQPHGSHTIFPFWVPTPNNQKSEIRNQRSDPSSDFRHSSLDIRHSAGRAGGYVELPYTLPQDSTLFLLLREETPEIWIRKLDWIAAQGGMALVNVHPDYCHFENDRLSRRTYPVGRYRDLLRYVMERYRSEFWQPLPGQLAAFVRKLSPQPILRRAKRVCMVTHSFYESDNRVTRYASALVARGDAVDVLALRQSPELPEQEIIEGVRVFRIQDRFEKAEQTKLAYLWPLLRFLRAAMHWLTRRHASGPYDLLHIHNVPDFMVFAGWYPKLTGARIILDIHDIVPEFFASKFGMMPKGLTFALLCWMERASAAFADHVIIANDLWLTKYALRTRTAGRCTAFINNVDSSVFTRRTRRRDDGKLIVLFPGGLQWHQGVDIALRAFTEVRAELPHCEFHVYGDGSAKESLVRLAADLGLDGSVRFFKPRSVREIAAIMAEADLGVVPKRADSFGNEAYSTKIMEFMAVGVPVVVSSTKVDHYYFDESVVRFFPSGDARALARQMLAVLRDAEMRQEMVRRASEYAATHSWDSRKADYLALVDSLCAIDVALPTPLLAQKAA